jgi:hypothetical protein
MSKKIVDFADFGKLEPEKPQSGTMASLLKAANQRKVAGEKTPTTTPSVGEEAPTSAAKAPTHVGAEAPTIDSTQAPILVGAKVPTSVGTHKQGDRHAPGNYRVNSRIPEALAIELKHLALDMEIDFQELVAQALTHFKQCVGAHIKEQVGEQSPTSVGAKVRYDDLKIFKTYDDIINLYEVYTGNRWKVKDDRDGQQFNGLDRRIIEVGILQTLLNFRGRKINSFKYFIPEIEIAIQANLKGETLDIFLKRRREQWQARQQVR